ncbi:S8 family serine peptidase [Chitinophaga nivalis]|uniref:S8 family serine peptidase n=1 Tax=Chitinophaga nivalis TaxID=2991709 RepID=A0ABT3IKZ5_9BACT|nr:S8 family serine peptidase [Chitinophaga nivalis]MCW3465670.1 S8 family serine peptidase [Chitinophaga nivalis]MCW3484639.1 S8 family serine peptidase [Chitinophaga nivalis]
MITHWQVIAEVANRFGGRQEQFETANKKLNAYQQEKIPLIQLEDDEERVHCRIARENTPVLAQALERITGTVDFHDKYILDKLAELSCGVCRLLKCGAPVGTGFLVTPDILLTNHHVIESAADAIDMVAEFNYELDCTTRLLKKSAVFRLDAAKFFLTSSLKVSKQTLNTGLDFTLIGVTVTGTSGEALSQFPPIRMDGNMGKIIKGESCIIVQHPNGLPKKVVLKDTKFFSETGTRLVYETDTLPGSSGAPVFALGTCSLIALHHSGLSRTDDQNRVLTKDGQLATADTPDEQIDWIGNEGIKISVIINAVKEATLPPAMEKCRNDLLQQTREVAPILQQAMPDQKEVQTVIDNLVTGKATPAVPALPGIPSPAKETNMDQRISAANAGNITSFIIALLYTPENIQAIEKILSVRYPPRVQIALLLPASARPGREELFSFAVAVSGNPHEAASELARIPGIYYAEADVPLYLNADTSFIRTSAPGTATESGFLFDDGYGKPNEDAFLETYTQKNKSPYVTAGQPEQFRKWNWYATGFDKILTDTTLVSPKDKGIQVVQFDTGYTNHSKVLNGFDTDQDYNFLNQSTDALDPRTVAIGKQPGHGTRTGSLLIGNVYSPAAGNGNCGLLTPSGSRLVPFRIAETVVIINRQQQLAAALDTAIAQGFDVITMSMGLPPTITTAQLARRAYESGIIWCCAAGNSVQAVVAPAVYPGTIAVAASNPLDRDWSGSSRGTMVDITAPGQDVYVPIWQEGALHPEGFAYGDGTSYATPHIAAAAAYWLAKYQDVLKAPAYAGWRRVEAFRTALQTAARRDNQLPRKGFGSGMLDVAALLDTPPLAADALKNSYDGWSDSPFLDAVQGYGELIKTYWNKLHSCIFGVHRGGQESLPLAAQELSAASQVLEQAIFHTTGSPYESVPATDLPAILERFNTLQSIVERAAK